MTHLVNDIKKKSGSDKLYLERDDVWKAMIAETDENRKAIFEWVKDNFNAIDYAKYVEVTMNPRTNHKDGLIGAGDLEKYFGITK